MAASDKEWSFYDYLLAEDTLTDEIPVEVLFDDLGVSGLVFPLNKYTKPRWEQQHPSVQKYLLLADIRDIFAGGNQTKVAIETWGPAACLKLEQGRLYRISPRLVDFNVTKVLTTLLELDLQCMQHDDPDEVPVAQHRKHPPFLQLMLDPKSFGRERESFIVEAENRLKKSGNAMQRLFRNLRDLDVDAARALVLKDSQNRAAQRILSNRLSVVWGPPGKL